MREAVKAGAEYRPNYEVEGPIVEGDSVVGVFGRDDKKKEYRLRSRLVIDCLGMTSTIRRKLPPNDFVEKDIKIEDIESTGRYIMNFEPVKEDLALLRPRQRDNTPQPGARPGRLRMGLPQEGQQGQHRHRRREEVPRREEREARQEGHAPHAHRRVRRVEHRDKARGNRRHRQQRQGLLAGLRQEAVRQPRLQQLPGRGGLRRDAEPGQRRRHRVRDDSGHTRGADRGRGGGGEGHGHRAGSGSTICCTTSTTAARPRPSRSSGSTSSRSTTT